MLPETILQFGSGKFLRGFADLFIAQANRGGQAVGRVVVVQTTGAGRARQLNVQQGRYHVVLTTDRTLQGSYTWRSARVTGARAFAAVSGRRAMVRHDAAHTAVR